MRISIATLRQEIGHARTLGVLPIYADAARRAGIGQHILLGKDSRESCLGMCLDAQGRGDGGNAWGLSQIDQRFHPEFTRSHAPTDHRAVIFYGADLLAEETARFNGDVAAGLVAYNAGPDAVEQARAAGVPIDTYTTGGDYSNDVLSRASAIAETFPDLAPAPAALSAGGGPLALVGLAGLTYVLAHPYVQP